MRNRESRITEPQNHQNNALRYISNKLCTYKQTAMTTLSRQNSVMDTSEQDSSPTPAAASALPETWPDGAAMLSDILPLADKLDANGQTKQDRKLGCRRVVELASTGKTNVAILEMLGADAVKAYCAAKAPGSIDTYCKMACAFLKLVTHAQGEQDLPPTVCREIAALEGMAADCESNRRNQATSPPAYMSFVGPTLELFEKFSTEHIEMNYTDLALGVWLIFTVLGVATRTRTMRAARWGVNVIKLDKGDWRIKLGDEENPGTKHSFPLDIKLSELAGLSKAGLLYHDYAATALDWLYRHTDGDTHGRLVFSRNSKKNSQFGKDVFGKFMIEKLGAGMDCGSLRRRMEINAAMAAEQKRISPHDRSLVSCCLQHRGKTAGLDYSDGGHEVEEREPELSPGGSTANSSEEEEVHIEEADPGQNADETGSNGTAMTIKTIVEKWEDQQENVRDPAVDPKVPLHFTRFLDGDDENFDTGNCITITPYEWFSASNGRDWCVSWDQYAWPDAALTDEEKAFVMDKFELFAAHFEPGAAEARRLLDQADHDYLSVEVAKLRTTEHKLIGRIKALEDAAAKSDSGDGNPEWLHEVMEAADDLKYDNCRTEGDIVRFQLALAKAARKKPAEVSANENAAYIKYHDLAEWLKKKTEPPPGDESDSESEYEESDDEEETVRAAISAVLAAMAKPRARKKSQRGGAGKKKSRYTQH